MKGNEVACTVSLFLWLAFLDFSRERGHWPFHLFLKKKASFLLRHYLRNKGSNFRFMLLIPFLSKCPAGSHFCLFYYQVLPEMAILYNGKRTQNTHYLEQPNSFRNSSFSRSSKSLRCNYQLTNKEVLYNPAEEEMFCIWKAQQCTGTHVLHPS